METLFYDKGVYDLEVLNISFRFAMDIFESGRPFPKNELHSLTDQVKRSSKSIAANIAEGWRRRSYENEFKKHLVDAVGSLEETKIWLLFAKECGYLSMSAYQSFCGSYDELGAKIHALLRNWKIV